MELGTLESIGTAHLAGLYARIHHVAGLTGDRTAIVTTRPFLAPHYTIADVGLIGGPMPLPLPRYGWRRKSCFCPF